MRRYYETEQEAMDDLRTHVGADWIFWRIAGVLLVAVGTHRSGPFTTTEIFYLVREREGLTWESAEAVE